jgi:hypothetical protein
MLGRNISEPSVKDSVRLGDGLHFFCINSSKRSILGCVIHLSCVSLWRKLGILIGKSWLLSSGCLRLLRSLLLQSFELPILGLLAFHFLS